MKNVIYIIVYVFSILWIVMGTSLVIYTDRTRKFFGQFARREYYPLWSVIAILLGALLIIGSFFSERILWLALILGIISCAKGVYLLKGPYEKVESIINWWYETASDETIRFTGLTILLLGIFLLAYLL
ncbi:MAG: hypothetical protein JW736_08290 [Deltaproteobacteria bacterium]|nr:hypothetical protein [Deltaproteobacteria bacterium]MBN2686559.1 hypothetical protein [Deltaproteobacteria bacterium]